MPYTPTHQELIELGFYARHYEYLMYSTGVRFTNFGCEYIDDNNPIEGNWYIGDTQVYFQSAQNFKDLLGIFTSPNIEQ